MAHAINSRRVEALLIVSDSATSGDEWNEVYAHFARHGLTAGYSQLRLDDVVY